MRLMEKGKRLEFDETSGRSLSNVESFEGLMEACGSHILYYLMP